MPRRAALPLLLCLSLPALGQAVPDTPGKDAPSATPAGTTFTVPAGWTVATKGALVVLGLPEPDSRVALLDLEARDADAAVTAAWSAFQPGFKRPLRLAVPAAARNGWEERRSYQYETSPNERAVVSALAMRAGAAWAVALIDGSEPTLEKRAAPLGLLLQSLRPKGYARESFAGRKAHPLDEQRLATLRQFVADGMQRLDVPGVGLAFIDGGKTVWAGGLGVKELGRPDPVGADTLFIAASNTKALTTLLLAELVDEGQLRWDQPVTEVFPSFKLGDEATTRQVLVKHLICACTGLPRQDMEWLFQYAGVTPRDAMGLLATMQPTSKFGELFQYSNMMAAAGGFAGGHVVTPGAELGAAYDEAMSQLFAGNSAGFGALFTDDAAINLSGHQLTGGHSFAKAASLMCEKAGWIGQDHDGWVEANGFLTLVGVNRFRDGRAVPLVGYLRFNDAGKVDYASSVGGGASS